MSTQTSDLATATPAEIDTRLYEIWKAQAAATRNVRFYRRQEASSRKSGWTDRAEAYAKTAEAYEEEARQLDARAKPLTDEFIRRGGWRRYYLVTNANGHVHREMGCPTCRHSTEYAWLVDLADADEAALVAEWGEQACTVCFPDAPAHKGYGDGTSAYARRTAAEAEAARLKRAADAEAKAARAIAAPDGSPLRVGGSVIRTKVAARNELSGRVKDYCWYGPGHPSDFATQIGQLVAALEGAGVETAAVIERAIKAAGREGATYTWAG